MLGVRHRHPRPLVDRRQPYPGHQLPNPRAADFVPLEAQVPHHLPRPITGRLQELRFDQTHQSQSLCNDRLIDISSHGRTIDSYPFPGLISQRDCSKLINLRPSLKNSAPPSAVRSWRAASPAPFSRYRPWPRASIPDYRPVQALLAPRTAGPARWQLSRSASPGPPVVLSDGTGRTRLGAGHIKHRPPAGRITRAEREQVQSLAMKLAFLH